MFTEVRVPAVSESVKSGKVVTVLVAPGDLVAVDQPLIELETDKAVVEIPSPAAGRVADVAVRPGQTIAVGEVIVRLEAAAVAALDPATPPTLLAPPTPPATPASPVPPAPPAPAEADRDGAEPAREPAPASPSVRRLARELGVDIDAVRGTAPGGRIGEDDVKEHARALLAGAGGAAGADAPLSAAVAPLPDFARWGSIRREALSRVREVTAENMARSWSTVPQVTQHDRADVTELEAFRREFARARPEARLTMTAIAVKIAAAALRVFPRFNTSLDPRRRELIFKDYVHVAVAVDTEHGLLVPVVRDADRKGILRIAAELTDLAARARSRKLALSELEGGTFAISNLGGVGGTSFGPLVYAPQVAILGISRAATEPVWREDGFAPRLLLPLSLSYDHRVIDGAEGARFLRWICEALRQPLTMLLEG